MLRRSHSVKRNKNLSVSTRLKLFLKHFLLLKGKLFLSSKKPWSLIASYSSPFCKARPIYLSLAKKSRIHGIPKTFLESPVSFMNVSINGHLSHSIIIFYQRQTLDRHIRKLWQPSNRWFSTETLVIFGPKWALIISGQQSSFEVFIRLSPFVKTYLMRFKNSCVNSSPQVLTRSPPSQLQPCLCSIVPALTWLAFMTVKSF